MLKSFKKIVKKKFLIKKTKKIQKKSLKFFFNLKKIKNPPPKKISKKFTPQKSFKKCFQKKFTYLLFMATYHDSTSIPIAFSL